MKTATIFVDIQDLPIFEKHLTSAGYVYSEYPGVTKANLSLRIKYEQINALKLVIKAADAECANAKEPSND